MSFNFKEGEYVVLLSTCNGNPKTWEGTIPVNYIYKLRSPADKYKFYPELDLKGSKTNGWSISASGRVVGGTDILNKLNLRLATPLERNLYNKNKGPVKVEEVKDTNEKEDLDYLSKLLIKLNIK
jgi:hypothetical protein